MYIWNVSIYWLTFPHCKLCSVGIISISVFKDEVVVLAKLCSLTPNYMNLHILYYYFEKLLDDLEKLLDVMRTFEGMIITYRFSVCRI